MIASFETTLKDYEIELCRDAMTTLQVNMGKLCNQACHHCHVEAGPKRTEIMEERTVNRLLELLSVAPTIEMVDITGGAPEMNPHFKMFVKEIRAQGKAVMDRCNLTVLYEPGQENTAKFLADYGVHVTASLPCYSKDNVEKQRGNGVFAKSINALLHLNQLGYGQDGSDLTLHLVYNPLGASLPPDQHALELDYKKRLKEDFSIDFNQLFAITNMPIKRFEHQLQRDGLMEEYMQLLLDNFNGEAAEGVMCQDLVSVGWDGQIYDCDFNQMLDIPIGWKPRSIWDIQTFDDLKGGIALANHCYGCTAGAGSSCGGTTV